MDYAGAHIVHTLLQLLASGHQKPSLGQLLPDWQLNATAEAKPQAPAHERLRALIGGGAS